jgi:diadenylate cyclase
LDIVLVAILIYQFLSLVRGTRAAPMLVGVATLGLAFYFARLGELRTLNWLLSTLLPYVVFALIVVFQSEIRHALANLGSRISLMRSSVRWPTFTTTLFWRPIFFRRIRPAR